MDRHVRRRSQACQPQPIDLVQDQTAVTATINGSEFAGICVRDRHGRQPAFAGNQRDFRAGTPPAFGATYIGHASTTRCRMWTGTVTGYPGCPCQFTATRHSFPVILPRADGNTTFNAEHAENF